MSFLKWPSKDPDAVKPYGIIWDNWLDEDTISTSLWILPSGITKVSDSHTTTRTIIWLSGGIAGSTVTLTNRVTTAGGMVDDRSVRLPIKEQ